MDSPGSGDITAKIESDSDYINVLVNNAGFSIYGPTETFDEEELTVSSTALTKILDKEVTLFNIRTLTIVLETLTTQYTQLSGSRKNSPVGGL
ncbi:hypothetical protein PDIDSM_8871 [Penicillium digitatum]|nr:hypothetical protein PDIDSM_8871 [Penicillium digitatum]